MFCFALNLSQTSSSSSWESCVFCEQFTYFICIFILNSFVLFCNSFQFHSFFFVRIQVFNTCVVYVKTSNYFGIFFLRIVVVHNAMFNSKCEECVLKVFHDFGFHTNIPLIFVFLLFHYYNFYVFIYFNFFELNLLSTI